MENVAVESGSVSRNSVLRNTYALLSLTMIWSTIMAAVGTMLHIGFGAYMLLALAGLGLQETLVWLDAQLAEMTARAALAGRRKNS